MDKNDMDHLIGTGLAASLSILAKPLIDDARGKGYAQAVRDLYDYISENADYDDLRPSHHIEVFAADKGINLDTGQPQDT